MLKVFQEEILKNVVVVALLDCCREEIKLGAGGGDDEPDIPGQRHVVYGTNLHSSAEVFAAELLPRATKLWLE